MAPAAGCPIIKCGNSGCTGTCLLSVVEYEYKAGTKPVTCRTCGKIFPRPNVTLSDFSPVKSDKKKGNRSRNVSPATSRRSRNTSLARSRRSSVVSWSDSPRDQAAPKSVDAVMVDCGEKKMCCKSVETHMERQAKGKESQLSMQNELPSETVPFSSDSGLSAGATSEHADISGLSAGSFAQVKGIPRVDCAVTHGFGGVEPVPRATYITTPSKPVFFSSGLEVTSEHAVISAIPAESSVPVQGTSCVGRVVSHGFDGNMSGGACGKETSPVHFARSQPDDVAQNAHVDYPGVELVSRATYIGRKKRNRETVHRHTKALMKAQCDANRKLVAQPEISHETAELILKNQAARTDEKFPGIIHVSHQLALQQGHENAFFCTQCGAVNAGGTLRLLKSQCDVSG